MSAKRTIETNMGLTSGEGGPWACEVLAPASSPCIVLSFVEVGGGQLGGIRSENEGEIEVRGSEDSLSTKLER